MQSLKYRPQTVFIGVLVSLAIFIVSNLMDLTGVGRDRLFTNSPKSAKNWEKADYDPEMRSQLGLQP
jgi:hypothetical protein